MQNNKILLSILAFVMACQGKNDPVVQKDVPQKALVSYVDPFIGTGAHGHTFPGAALPFGMVQLSPDTGVEGWDWCSGYHYSDSSIMGFSHTHLSGTGRGDLLDILAMPTTGPLQTVPGTKEDPDGGYRSRFSHEREKHPQAIIPSTWTITKYWQSLPPQKGQECIGTLSLQLKMPVSW